MAPPQDKHDEPDLEGLATDSNLPGQAPSSTALSTTAATASTAADDASSAWAPTGYGKSPVPRWLRWPSLLLWNVACIGSLVVALVWFTEDVSEKRVFTGLVGTFNRLTAADGKYRPGGWGAGRSENKFGTLWRSHVLNLT